VGLAIGIFLVLIGATFAFWGVYRLSRPRRKADVEWIRSNPLSNLTLGGSLLGFDRSGALASLLVGVVGILLGLAALVAA
jgi:high-affinity Fe2+/Pb2+ permease